MRLIAAILCALFVAGCATSKSTPSNAGASPAPHRSDAEADYAADAQTAAAALVFDPPLQAGRAPLDLSRAERAPVAFASYDEVFTTFFYVRLDDRQKLSSDGTSERRVVSETFGISRR